MSRMADVIGVTSLALSAIRTDGGTQPRAQLDLTYIADLAQAIEDGVTLPPVIVFYDGAEYWLADGFHRYHATQEVGREDIDADIRQGTRRDAVLYSVGANAQHGLRRTNADKRRSVETLLNDPEWVEWPDNQIAKQCGVNQSTVSRIRQENPSYALHKMENPFRIVERNGSTYIMNTTHIGVPPQEGTTEIIPASQFIEELASPKFPPGWGLVNGKKFDMPLPDGKPIELPESWKLPPSLREGVAIMTTPVEMDRVEHDVAPLPISRGVPPALQMSESNEWYTPAAYVDAARELMGGIDVDPASNEYANSKVVKASTYYDIQTNGLDKEWHGRIWLNPPYGRESGDSNQETWSRRLIEQYEAGITTEAVLLVNAVTDRKWFQPLWNYPICFTDHRIRFYNQETEAGQPTHGNALIYFGSQIDRFIALFRQFGPVVRKVG